MDRKYLKWSLIVPTIFFVLAVIGITIYIFFPLIFNSLLNTKSTTDPCSGASIDYSGTNKLGNALTSLCTTSKSLLGAAVMLLIVIGGFLSLIPVGLSGLEVFKSQMSGTKKALWLVVLLFGGYFGALAYYFVKPKN